MNVARAHAPRWHFDANKASAYAIFVVLALVYVLAVTTSTVFLNPRYIFNIITQTVPVGIAAIGVTYVMILGEVDLSIGAIVSATLVVCAVVMRGDPANIPLAIAVTCIVGLAIGAINGVLVAFGRASSFILTLGTGLAIAGITQILSGGIATGMVAPGFREFFNHRLFERMSVLAVMLLALTIVGILIQRSTVFGRRLYLGGSNRAAALLSGLPISRTIIVAYMLSGLFGAIAGMALLARSGLSGTNAGDGFEFQVLAAIVLGGTTFEGGRGGVGGSIAGCLVLVIAFNLVNIAGLPFYSQLIVMGVIIIAASSVHGNFAAKAR